MADVENMEEIRDFVRETYGRIATEGGGCCSSSCCPTDGTGTPGARTSAGLGYRDRDLAAVPAGSNLGLGCGNPDPVARLQRGETVLDLGSGGGLDCFLAARQVGSQGHLIGVDMTAEMVRLARQNLSDGDVDNVEFRLGEIEHLPVADGIVDVIMSNCVINLLPDKPAVFREAIRVLKPGGRLAVSDIVATSPVPSSGRRDPRAVASCLGGAATVTEITEILSNCGFVDVRIDTVEQSAEIVKDWAAPLALQGDFVSATIQAWKPA